MKSDVYYSVLTPPGRGAIAVLEIVGKSALGIVEDCFKSFSGRPVAEFAMGSIVYGRWLNDEGVLGEDLVVCRTRPEAIEVHCHGGSAAIAAIISSLELNHVRRLQVALHKFDFITSHKHLLPCAPTKRTALFLLSQLGPRKLFLRKLIQAAKLQSKAQALEQITAAISWKRLVNTWFGPGM